MSTEQKKILIFEPLSGGHRTNFFYWLKKETENRPDADGRFIFFGEAEAESICPGISTSLDSAGRWSKPWLLYRLLRRACKEILPDHVLILELTHLELPLALFGSPVSLSAILFVQYPELVRGAKYTFKKLKTRRLLYRAPVEKLFLLNGQKSCSGLTESFKDLAQFIPVPDPLPAGTAEVGFDLKNFFKLPEDRNVFLFFGAISPRKGADVLLQALQKLSPDVAEQSVFLFSGTPESGYDAPFRAACEQLRLARPDVLFYVQGDFVSDARMMAMFEQSDIVLMPYLRPEYSSGVLALAAQAGTPVIGPSSGLLGRLIVENGLGVTSKCIPADLAEAISSPVEVNPAGQKAFAEQSDGALFAKKIVDVVCDEG